MDEWKEKELRMMQIGGNAKATTFFKNNGVSDMTNVINREH